MAISKEAEERRNEILDKAMMLFVTKGYEKTTINNILQEVGIAKGTFYYYFKSKEEVLDAIIMRVVDEGVRRAELVADDPNLSVYEKAFAIIMAQKHEEGPQEDLLEELHEAENAQMHQKSLVQMILKLTPIMTKVIEQGINEGLFQTDYPKEAVEFILTAPSFLFDRGLFQWTEEEFKVKVEAFVDMIERILGAKKGSFDYMKAAIK